jgi:hypothetical protein
MRTRLTRIAIILTLAVLVALAFQLSSARQQDTHNTTPPPVSYNANENARVGIPYNKTCRNACDRAYRRCLRSGKGRATCRRLHRDCLQRCPQ